MMREKGWPGLGEETVSASTSPSDQIEPVIAGHPGPWFYVTEGSGFFVSHSVCLAQVRRDAGGQK